MSDDFESQVAASTAQAQKWRRFRLDGTKPEMIVVREITPKGHATHIYAVVADYGWAETILAGDCYDHTANDLAAAVGTFLGIPFVEVPDALAGDGGGA